VDFLGTIHTGLGVASLLAGAAVALQPKGTRRHRFLGRTYVLSMFGLNGTALLLYRLTGTFNFFHVAALLSLLTLILGMLPTRARPFAGFFVARHAYFMSGSYVGVLAATAAEIMTRVPGAPFVPAAIAASVVTCALGSWVILRSVPQILPHIKRSSESPLP